MAYQMAATIVTLKDFHRLQVFSNAIRRTFVQHFTRFQLTACSHGSSASTELLVIIECGIARFLCAMHVFEVQASSSSLGYLCVKFSFFHDLHCWASPWRKITYSLTHSLSLFDALQCKHMKQARIFHFTALQCINMSCITTDLHKNSIGKNKYFRS